MNGPGSDRTAYLDYVARCRQVFTPFAPIELPDFFAGRAHVIEDVRGELQAPGRQVAIYGERGVGKTSLALLLYFFAGYDDDKVHVFRCQKASAFDDICLHLLTSAGYLLGVNAVETESARSGEARVGPITGGVSRRTTVSYRAVRDARAITASTMLEVFQKERRLLIVDEFDRVRDGQTKTRMAELIKHFSDARSETKIVIVGVAETLNELIGQHESLSRSLAQIGLKRMDEAELRDIIKRGAERTRAEFDRSVALQIVRLADGFPYFVHLICWHASRVAARQLLKDRTRTVVVGDSEYAEGLQKALENAEHTLAEQYKRAVITTRRTSDKFALILSGMALAEPRDVRVQDIARAASMLASRDVKAASLSRALGELSSERRGNIVTKVREGYYKFSNPLVRPYIRAVMEQRKLIVASTEEPSSDESTLCPGETVILGVVQRRRTFAEISRAVFDFGDEIRPGVTRRLLDRLVSRGYLLRSSNDSYEPTGKHNPDAP
jgi:Cdc6-like AAA superfamily ATPase